MNSSEQFEWLANIYKGIAMLACGRHLGESDASGSSLFFIHKFK